MGWRISEEDEVEGIDVATHGEAAYDLDRRPAAGTVRSAGVRATVATVKT